jgi:hypothetical protein
MMEIHIIVDACFMCDLCGCQRQYKSTQRAFSANGRRVDGIIATINALGGSMSTPEETNEKLSTTRKILNSLANKSINNYERSQKATLKFTSLKLKNKMSKCELSTRKGFMLLIL